MNNELQEALRNLKKRDVDTFPVKVVSVDKTNATCKVSDGSLEYTDVQLSSVIDEEKSKFILFPAVHSWVLVSPINEDLKRLYVECCSTIESVALDIESVTFQVDKDGFLLKKQNETLKGLMSDLIAAIKAMSFALTTPDTINGTTTTLINAAEFSSIETRFNQFLKDN